MNEAAPSSPRVWYREAYVWLVIALPLSAVIGGIITAWYAIESNDGLVVDDYYKRGLEINRVLERDKASERYGLHATLHFEAGTPAAAIVLKGNSGFTPPDSISVSFLNATRSGHDHKLEFRRVSADTYQSAMPPLLRGHWYIQIEKQDWRLLKSISVP